MELFILTFLFFGLAALGMAVGVLLKGPELKGDVRNAWYERSCIYRLRGLLNQTQSRRL